MDSIVDKWFVKDDFLSDIFGICWLQVEPSLSAGNCKDVFHSISRLSAATKVDWHVDASDSDLAILLQHLGWYLGNTKVSYTYDPRDDVTLPVLPEGVHIMPLEERHAATLIEQSPSLFLLDRYRRDPNLDKSRVADLYHRWLSNNISFRCDEIMTAVHGNDLLGFVCMIRKPDFVYLELIGVFQTHQHKGIGNALVGTAVQKYGDMPIKVVTQYHNIPMQRVLVSCGFKPADAAYIFTIHV